MAEWAKGPVESGIAFRLGCKGGSSQLAARRRDCLHVYRLWPFPDKPRPSTTLADWAGSPYWLLWYDYFSAPQKLELDSAPHDTRDNLAKAISSLASYIAVCGHFIVLAPSVVHEESDVMEPAPPRSAETLPRKDVRNRLRTHGGVDQFGSVVSCCWALLPGTRAQATRYPPKQRRVYTFGAFFFCLGRLMNAARASMTRQRHFRGHRCRSTPRRHESHHHHAERYHTIQRHAHASIQCTRAVNPTIPAQTSTRAMCQVRGP